MTAAMFQDNNEHDTETLDANELFHTAFEVLKAKAPCIGAFIVLRKNQEVKCVARVHNAGLALYYRGEELFQDFLRAAVARAETIIYTLGPEPERPMEYTGRLYNPSSLDTYEFRSVVKDITGLSL